MTVTEATLRRLMVDLSDAQDVLQGQSKRIARLQAELDQLRAEFYRRPSD